MSDLPTGTLTFLFTDIEGSTLIIQRLGSAYPALQSAHNEILRQAFRARGGYELRTEGDSFFVVFPSAIDGCLAAVQAQEKLEAYPWPEGGRVKVRIGLNTGEASLVGGDYVGLDVHRAARVAGAAHGGQILLSASTRMLVERALPAGMTLTDLGLHRLKDLAHPEHLFQLSLEGRPNQFPTLRTLESTPNNLPIQMTSFIGRDDQVREAKQLLLRSRLLTLTGPGGTGKTRLSLQIAAELLEQFPDGVYFVPLASVQDPELVPSVIAQTLSVPITGSQRPIDRVLEHLKGKRTLLVLDNFEQLTAAGPTVVEVLRSSEQLRVLLSSRAVLHVYGEQEFQVPPLRLPDPRSLPSLAALSQYEGVQLFIERAIAVKPDFRATDENAASIAGICERVDGLPLAIELAAARTKLFSPQALMSRLDKTLTALGSGARDLPGRQQTLRGAIAWSYDLLDARAQRLVARFSVFARGGSLEQAEAVCGPDEEIGGLLVDRLDQLADQSLMRRLPELEEPRFVMLQTIREFALERLNEGSEAEAIRERHARAFLQLAERAEQELFGPNQKSWLDQLEREHDNFRAALEWCGGRGDARTAMLLGASLWRFWQMRGHLHEGRSRLAQVLALPESARYPKERLRVLEAAGGLAYWQADMTEAQRFYDECLELTRQVGDTRAIANAIYNDAFPSLVGRTSTPRARLLLTEALGLFRALDDEAAVARTLWGLGNADYFDDNNVAARKTLEEAERLLRKVDDRFSLGWCLHTLGLTAIKLGDAKAAAKAWLEALTLFEAAHDVAGLVVQIDNLSVIARLGGNPLRAARLAAAASAHQVSSGTGLAALLTTQEGRTGREGLSEEAASRAWAEGQAMTLEEAIAYARDQAVVESKSTSPS
ncbi:MAG TPA: AAA family ATPase [Candidatus Dormibacteraeota bacterium]